MPMMECAAFDLQRVDSTDEIHIVGSAGCEEFEVPVKITLLRDINPDVHLNIKNHITYT